MTRSTHYYNTLKIHWKPEKTNVRIHVVFVTKTLRLDPPSNPQASNTATDYWDYTRRSILNEPTDLMSLLHSLTIYQYDYSFHRWIPPTFLEVLSKSFAKWENLFQKKKFTRVQFIILSLKKRITQKFFVCLFSKRFIRGLAHSLPIFFILRILMVRKNLINQIIGSFYACKCKKFC